jgi:Xaa-Pro aminopeptidase
VVGPDIREHSNPAIEGDSSRRPDDALRAELQSRRARVASAMADQDLDVLVATSLENFYYSSGSMLLSKRTLPTRVSFFVWTSDGDGAVVACRSDLEPIRSASWVSTVHGYREFEDQPSDALADYLIESGADKGRIGVDEQGLPAAYFNALKSRLPMASLLPADDLFESLRMVKSDYEIQILSRAAMGADRAIRDALESASEGWTEKQLADRLRATMLLNGADAIPYVFVATGPNVKMMTTVPTDTPIGPGDLVLIDIGGYWGTYYGGYMSDLARMAVASEANARHVDTYRRLHDLHLEMLAAIRPGTRACDLFAMYRAAYERRGLALTHSYVGHGIGLNVHEHPIVEPSNKVELVPGTVMCFEPMTFDDGVKFHVEDTIVITSTGAELLSPGGSWEDIFRLN